MAMGPLVVVVNALAIVAFLSSLIGRSQAACSPCPFQWSEHQHHCYLYFSSPLPYGQAEEYCRSQHARRYAGGLAALDSVDEVLFIMDYVGRVINGSSNPNIPEYVWLDRVDRPYENYSIIYHNALNAANESDHDLRSCDALSPASAVSLSDLDTGNYGMVPAPEVVEQRCAVYAGEGAHLDLGDFAGTCVSDPDACASEAVTWSVWIKINSTVPFNPLSFFLSTGAYTYQARGVDFFYNKDLDMLQVGARSLRKSWSFYSYFAGSGIPLDTWFHLAAAVDLTQVSAQLLVYLDGVPLTEDSTGTPTVSTTDLCTHLVLGSVSPRPDLQQSSTTSGSSAAYSNLMAFDHLLTAEQIDNLHSCGSLDWGLKVRSLYFDANSSYSGNLRYVCKASASTGPTIYWRVYHADQAQWEDLGPSSGPGVDITPTSFSTCVVQSVLVIDRSRGPSSDGDIISCTASTGSLNTAVYLEVNATTFEYSHHDNAGYLSIPKMEQHYQSNDSQILNTLGSHPFICELETLG